MSAFPVPDVVQGHVGHLSKSQAAALATFKANLEKAGLYQPDPPSHDEPTLLRFLRARKFDPVKAQTQFADTEAWRKQHDVDNLYSKFPVDEFEDSKRFYPRWTGRRDKQGLPIYVYRLASLQHIHKELDKVPAQRRYQRIVSLYEAMVHLVLNLCTHLPHATASTPISSVTTIIDLEGASMSLMWTLRAHLQQASVLATANYPETLSATIVVGAPSFFSTIWGWVKSWFDEGTRDKVHIVNKEHLSSIHALIDPKDLPKIYGGELEWTFEDSPALDEEAKVAVGGQWPRGPVWFKDGKVVYPSERV